MKLPSRWLWIVGLVVVVLGVGGFLYFRQNSTSTATQDAFRTEKITRGDLASTVGATGTVRANQTTHVVWQTNGRVAKINGVLQSQVKKGQTLAELDSASLSQSIISAKADLVNARKTLNDLSDSATAKAKAELTLAQAKIDLKDAQDEVARKQYRRASDATLNEMRSNYILAADSLKNAEERYSMLSGLKEDSVDRAYALAELSKAQKTRDKALYNLNYSLGLPDRNEVDKANAKLQVAKAALDDAQRAWEKVKNGINPDDLAAAKARVEAIEATLKNTSLEAPIDGQITEVNIMVGDDVSPNKTAFRIDDLSRLVIDVDLTEVDINRISLGQPVEITFDAVSNKKYQGSVYEVGQVGTESGNAVNFVVKIEMIDPDQMVRPGMTAAVNIQTQKVDNVLMVPNRAIRYKDNKRLVYVLQNKQQVGVPVEIGASSDTYSEVVSGDLKEGDLLILNPIENLMQAGGPPAGARN
jgi:HlyD family secretion protein